MISSISHGLKPLIDVFKLEQQTYYYLSNGALFNDHCWVRAAMPGSTYFKCSDTQQQYLQNLTFHYTMCIVFRRAPINLALLAPNLLLQKYPYVRHKLGTYLSFSYS
jgi:hypothetical protein